MYNYMRTQTQKCLKTPFSTKFDFSITFPKHLPTHLLIFMFLFTFFMRIASVSCSVSTSDKFFLSGILLSVWLIFNTTFLNWKLITLVLLTWIVILLAASFDNIWNSMEYVINLDDIWRYLSETSDIWVEQYLPIINDNLAIFDDRNVHTEARKLLSKRHRQISSFIP